MTRKRTNPDFLNGVPELLILHLISQRPMYGYEIVQAIKVSTGEVLEFGEGCIYPILHRLEADEFLTSQRETVSGRSRVVYRVTARGRKRLSSTIVNWRQIITAVNQALQGGEHGEPAVV